MLGFPGERTRVLGEGNAKCKRDPSQTPSHPTPAQMPLAESLGPEALGFSLSCFFVPAMWCQARTGKEGSRRLYQLGSCPSLCGLPWLTPLCPISIPAPPQLSRLHPPTLLQPQLGGAEGKGGGRGVEGRKSDIGEQGEDTWGRRLQLAVSSRSLCSSFP